MTKSLKTKFITATLMGAMLLVLCVSGRSQDKLPTKEAIQWKTLDVGLAIAEIPGPFVSKYSDSKVTVVKINPDNFDFDLIIATESDTSQRTIKDWCTLKHLYGAINAGMYSLKDNITALGYMQNYTFVNNPVVKENFNALVVFNPKNVSLPSFQIVDMTNQDWKAILENYNCCFQSIRMIDNTGNAIYWSHKPILSCSMCVLAKDKAGNVLFLFARSPYNANEFIDFMLGADLNIQTAMYLEGGPETSIYVKTADVELCKFGSYVSGSNPDDDNVELWKLPNILGFHKKVAN